MCAVVSCWVAAWGHPTHGAESSTSRTAQKWQLEQQLNLLGLFSSLSSSTYVLHLASSFPGVGLGDASVVVCLGGPATCSILASGHPSPSLLVLPLFCLARFFYLPSNRPFVPPSSASCAALLLPIPHCPPLVRTWPAVKRPLPAAPCHSSAPSAGLAATLSESTTT